jgi:hypothetical protein
MAKYRRHPNKTKMAFYIILLNIFTILGHGNKTFKGDEPIYTSAWIFSKVLDS